MYSGCRCPDGSHGVIGPTDPGLLDTPAAGLLVTVAGGDATLPPIALPTTGASARVSTYSKGGTNRMLRFDVA
jgi:hypothetical protein